MEIRIYDGCGNDFVLVDYSEKEDYGKLAQTLCSVEHFDTDGLIAVKKNPLEMIYYNKDGSRAPMCGNGIRCFSLDVSRTQKFSHQKLLIDTLSGIHEVEVLQEEPFVCTVNMGSPDYQSIELGIDRDLLPVKQKEVLIDDVAIKITSVFMGTVHTVVFVPSIQTFDTHLGEKICTHPLFKKQTNVNFVEVKSPTCLIVRTYERGVGWTKACGTGCCAAYVVARDLGYVNQEQEILILLEDGTLQIKGTESIKMTGPTQHQWTIQWEEDE
ncbi:MAG: diaminopimelate epimerase [Enterococcus sp.]